MVKARAERIGIYGGSFDPVHLGHLVIAQDALEQAELDRLYFVPAGQSPLKKSQMHASPAQRLAMLELALQDRPNCGILDLEFHRKGPSYTYDTIMELRLRWPDAEIYWLIGADQVEQLPRWHRIEALLDEIHFLCVSRPGYDLTLPEGMDEARFFVLAERQIPISSTEIRDRLKHAKPVDFFLPPAIVSYIQEHSLYGVTST